MKLRYFFITLFSILLLAGSWVFYLHKNNQTKLISPVLGVSKIAFSDNVWFPKDSKGKKEKNNLQITSEAAFFVETQTGEVLFEKNSNEKLPIASLTKIMTAIITLENRQMADVLTVSKKAAEIEPDKMLLIAGEKMTVQELLGGLFLVSANDASEVFAQEVTGNREEFIKLMNLKARQLGMNNSNFINPSGLEEDPPAGWAGRQYQLSTAYEVALMSRYAIYKWPKLIEITSNPHIYIPRTETHQDYDLYSGINLISTYPGVIGFKTGFTPEAGLTLVTLARRDGREVLGVLLGSVNRRDDAKALLDYSFSKLGVN